MLEDPQKILMSKISIFLLKKDSEIALLGLGKFQKEQSHEFWWTLFLFYRYGKLIHGRAGQKDPPQVG